VRQYHKCTSVFVKSTAFILVRF